MIKLNTDGSVGNSTAGMGGIFRDCGGEVLMAYAGPLYSCNVIKAELMGLKKGLDICLERGYINVNIEVDVMLLIQIVENNILLHPQFFYLLKKIRMAMSGINCSFKTS
ncbi:Putative ribonuclease H protein [Dendrobium catenatum]|uniref:Ribonuclease H protein n=1 Tax=Dendrobium catenatum TaxID=906689 RepID=A0A2I0VP06_9ASPA|nr:Putative ribonuclease H protein [Dendrobium catenatum]